MLGQTFLPMNMSNYDSSFINYLWAKTRRRITIFNRFIWKQILLRGLAPFLLILSLNNDKLMRKSQVRVSIAKIDPIFRVSFFFLLISTSIWIVAFWSLSYFIRIFYWVFSACLIWITPILGYICIFQKGVWQRLIISWTDENLYNYVPMMTHLLRWYWSKQFGNNWKI